MSPAKRAAAFLALISALLTFNTAGSRSEQGDERFRPHELGTTAGIFNNSFIDDVISPVVYTSTSPVYEFFYRYTGEVHRHVVSIQWVSYTAELRDGTGGDYVNIFYSDGEPYSYTRSMHQMEGNRYELVYKYSGRISRFHDGKAALFLGFDTVLFSEGMESLDHWSEDLEWWRDKSRVSGFSIAVSGMLERRLRKYDRLSIDLHLDLFSFVNRPPYYYPLETWEDYDPSKSNMSFMLPNDFLRWSAQFSYVFWIIDSVGLEGYYRFQHTRVTEPRDLRYISNTVCLGVMYAFKGKK